MCIRRIIGKSDTTYVQRKINVAHIFCDVVSRRFQLLHTHAHLMIGLHELTDVTPRAKDTQQSVVDIADRYQLLFIISFIRHMNGLRHILIVCSSDYVRGIAALKLIHRQGTILQSIGKGDSFGQDILTFAIECLASLFINVSQYAVRIIIGHVNHRR